MRCYQNQKRRPVWVDLNPKAVTNDELFGIINPATREWKDGLFSCVMRDLSNVTHNGPKWIVLDGDIDPMWIESLNTVMDDNKVGNVVFREVFIELCVAVFSRHGFPTPVWSCVLKDVTPLY